MLIFLLNYYAVVFLNMNISTSNEKERYALDITFGNSIAVACVGAALANVCSSIVSIGSVIREVDICAFSLTAKCYTPVAVLPVTEILFRTVQRTSARIPFSCMLSPFFPQF